MELAVGRWGGGGWGLKLFGLGFFDLAVDGVEEGLGGWELPAIDHVLGGCDLVAPVGGLVGVFFDPKGELVGVVEEVGDGLPAFLHVFEGAPDEDADDEEKCRQEWPGAYV